MTRRPPDQSSPCAIDEILYRLNSGDPGAAWAAFIDRYSPLILRAIRQFEYEQERSNDCYLHVCEKLCENGFQRLLKFNTKGPAGFRTWLGSVVFNLCVDWHRKEFGRVVLLPAITALPVFDQAVYRLHFERAMDRESCRRILMEEFPDLSRAQLAESIARVHQVLTPRQRWKISVRNRSRLHAADTERDLRQVPDPGVEPDDQFEQVERRRHLQRALAGLSPVQRNLLLLRYEQGLTLKKVAELMNLGDPFRARREIQEALDALARALQRAGLKNLTDTSKN